MIGLSGKKGRGKVRGMEELRVERGWGGGGRGEGGGEGKGGEERSGRSKGVNEWLKGVWVVICCVCCMCCVVSQLVLTTTSRECVVTGLGWDGMITKLSTVINSFMDSEMVNNDTTASSAEINRSNRRACHVSSLATSSSSRCTPSTVDTL